MAPEHIHSFTLTGVPFVQRGGAEVAEEVIDQVARVGVALAVG